MNTMVQTVAGIGFLKPRIAAPKISFIPQMKYVLETITIFCLEYSKTAGLSDIIDDNGTANIADIAPIDAPRQTVIITPLKIASVALFMFFAPMFWLTYGITASAGAVAI